MERASAIKYFNPIFFRGECDQYRHRRHPTILLGVGSYHQEVNESLGRARPFLFTSDLDRRTRVCIIGQEIVDELELDDESSGQELIVGRQPSRSSASWRIWERCFGQSRTTSS